MYHHSDESFGVFPCCLNRNIRAQPLLVGGKRWQHVVYQETIRVQAKIYFPTPYYIALQGSIGKKHLQKGSRFFFFQTFFDF